MVCTLSFERVSLLLVGIHRDIPKGLFFLLRYAPSPSKGVLFGWSEFIGTYLEGLVILLRYTPPSFCIGVLLFLLRDTLPSLKGSPLDGKSSEGYTLKTFWFSEGYSPFLEGSLSLVGVQRDTP